MSFRKTMDELAKKLVGALERKMAADDTPLQDITDTFKALTAYYSACAKDKSGDPTDEGGTFADFRARIGAEQERKHEHAAPVPSGARRRN